MFSHLYNFKNKHQSSWFIEAEQLHLYVVSAVNWAVCNSFNPTDTAFSAAYFTSIQGG